MVTQGSFSLLTQGTIICPFGSETNLTVLDSIIRFIFKNDSVDTQQRNEFELTDNILKVIFVNFNNEQGTVTTEPMLVGNNGVKEIFLSAAIYAIGPLEKNIKIVHYNFFEKLGEMK